MLGLPSATEVKKIIPKRALYSKFQLNTAEQKELDEARRRIRELESENEFLKKAAAFFARSL
jgi:transposase